MNTKFIYFFKFILCLSFLLSSKTFAVTASDIENANPVGQTAKNVWPGANKCQDFSGFLGSPGRIPG